MIKSSPVLSPFGQTVLKTGKILIMLIMLIPIFLKKWLNSGNVNHVNHVNLFGNFGWEGGGPRTPPPPLGPQKKKTISVINISLVLGPFWANCA